MSTPATPTALPEGVRAGNEQLVQLTPEAGTKVTALMAREGQGEFLRLAITGGGCNGLSYKMKFTPVPRRGDILVQTAGVPVVVDSKVVSASRGCKCTARSSMAIRMASSSWLRLLRT